MFAKVASRTRAGLARALDDQGAETLQGRNYRNLLLSGVWFGPLDGGIFNYLPVFIARLGASATIVSLLTTGPSLLSALSYIPGGAFAERHKDQVRLVFRSAMITRLFYFLIALLPLFLDLKYVPAAVIVLWSLQAIPNAVQFPAFMGVVQRAVSAKQRPRLNGTRWALMSLASGTSIAIFGFLLDRGPFPIGYQVVFALSVCAGLMNMYYFSKVVVPAFVSVRGEAPPSQHTLARVGAFLRPFTESRRFMRFGAANFAYRLALTLPAGLYSIFWVRNLQATDTWIGLRGTMGYAALVLGYWFWGRMAGQIGHRRILIICGAGQAFYPVLTALAPSMQWLLPAAVVWGLTIGGIELGLFDMLLAACPEGRQPSFAAAGSMTTSLGVMLGPLLGAALAQATTIQTALFAVGLVQMAATAGFLLLPSREEEALA